MIIKKYGIDFSDDLRIFDLDTLEDIGYAPSMGYTHSIGPPHDRSYNWEGSGYVELLGFGWRDRVLGGIVYLVVHETIVQSYDDWSKNVPITKSSKFELVPYRYNGKFVIDLYGDLRTSKGVMVYE
jgi:hypothetical protein